MPQAQDEAGNIWEVDAQGNPVRLVRAANTQGGRVFTLPKTPEKAKEETRKDKQDQREEIKFEERNAPQLKAGYRWKGGVVGGEAEPIPGLPVEGETGKQQQEKTDRISRLNQLIAQINRVQTLYNGGVGTTKDMEGLLDYLPTDDNARFDAAGAALSQQGLAAFRVPGTGTVTDRDAIMFDRANLPTAATRDAAIEEQLLGLRSRINEESRALGLAAPNWVGVAQQKADNEVPGQATGGATKPPPNNPSSTPPENGSGNPPGNAPRTPWDQGPSAPGSAIASGDTQIERSDRLSAQVDAMINAGASTATINAVLKQQGFPAIREDQFNAARQWMKDNPGQQYYGADITRSKPLPLLSQIAGSAVGSGVANYADAATAGIAGSLAGDQGRGALDAMRKVNPNASAIGSVLGGITGAAGAEMGIASRAPAALAQYAPRIADVLYGGLTGANNAKAGEGMEGAAIGAITGGVGGALGERVLRGVGNATQGIRNDAVRVLRDRGVPLTVGQAVEGSGWLGAGIKKLEDAGTSLPFIGNMIEARRMEGLRGFNEAAFQDAAAPGANITAIGADGMGQVRQSVGDAYSRALDPVTIDAGDPALINDLGGVIANANRIPNVNGAQDAALAALQARIDGAVDPTNDIITGRGFQEAYRGLARTGRERANGDYGHEVGQVMRQGQDALAGALERQNPGAFDGFLEANAANRRANVLADAIGAAKNQREELITPAQLNRADATSTSRLEGKINSAAGNRPFYDLATAGQAVLPSRLPDSGTWTRALTGAGLTGGLGAGGYATGGGEGAATGAGAGLGATLALALGGSRTAQRAATSLLLDRPELFVTIGEQLARYAPRVGGAAGAGIATPLMVAR